jgi:phosphatidate cytidylyltransferase
MMSMSPELKKRVLTGVIGAAALVLLIVFGGRLGIFFLTTGLSLGMLYEFTDITFSMPDKIEKRYVLLSMTWFLALVNLLASQTEFQLLTLSFLSLFVYFLVTAQRYEESQLLVHFKELMYSLFALFYLVFIPIYLQRIYDLSNGVEWTLVFLLIVWSGDSAAYFAGKKYGKKKLYPKISPKKTWEGAFGGLSAGLLVTLLFKLLFFRSMSWGAALVLPLIVGSVAQVGDFCESFFKRAFDVKDSGSILPGHGGFLDRFDGVVFSLPVMYACIRILG